MRVCNDVKRLTQCFRAIVCKDLTLQLKRTDAIVPEDVKLQMKRILVTVHNNKKLTLRACMHTRACFSMSDPPQGARTKPGFCPCTCGLVSCSYFVIQITAKDLRAFAATFKTSGPRIGTQLAVNAGSSPVCRLYAVCRHDLPQSHCAHTI